MHQVDADADSRWSDKRGLRLDTARLEMQQFVPEEPGMREDRVHEPDHVRV
jgi:hypothetical protein